MKKKGSCLEKEIIQGTMPSARRRGRPSTACVVNIKTWTGLSVEESVRMTEDRDKWRSASMVWPTLGSRTAKDQIRYPVRLPSWAFFGTGSATGVYQTSCPN